MEVNDLSSSLILRKPTASALKTAPKLASTTPEPRASSDSQSRALDVLRQELRARLDLRFSANPSRTRPVVPGYTVPATADGIAGETLGRAKGLSAADPGNAPAIIVRFRSALSETASFLSNTLASRSDVGRVGEVADSLDARLAALESEVAGNRVASTEVLSVQRRTRESSRIEIRTQEGDIVRLNLVNSTKLKAEDAFASNASGELSITELKFQERNGVRLTVKGDLNDAELAAIQSVFDQAAEVASEFFAGDLDAAFAAADQFVFDTDQIGNVNLRFLQFESQTVTYARETISAPEPATRQPLVGPVIPENLLPVINRPAPTRADDIPVAPPPTPESTSEERPLTVAPDSVEQPPEPAAAQPVAETDPRDSLVGLIRDFLTNVQEGFVGAEQGEVRQFYFSETFKLKLLVETIRVQAPAAAQDGADRLAEAVSASGPPVVEPKTTQT